MNHHHRDIHTAVKYELIQLSNGTFSDIIMNIDFINHHYHH